MNIKKISLFICTFFLFFIIGCNKDATSLKEYAITFNGYNNETIDIILVKENEKITYPEAPIVEGYEFIGWDQNLEYATKDITINANYKILLYTVTFYDINNNIITTQKVEYNNNATVPMAPTIEGCQFIKWDQDITNVKNDLEVRPIYDGLSYVIKFYDHNNQLIEEITAKYGEEVTAPEAPQITGYKFVGWDQKFNNITSNLVVKPIYQILVYTVTFYDANNNIISTQEVEYNKSALAPNNPIKEGYEFIGWSSDFQNVTSDLQIKPLYDGLTYIVKFYDADNNVIYEQKIPFGSNATAPTTPEKTGHTFEKWDSDFNNVKTNLDVKPIYKINKYIVAFYDAFDNVINYQEINYGFSATAPINPTKDGYKFIGWDQDYTYITKDLIVKPLFEKNVDNTKYIVKFYDANDNVISAQEVAAGKAATAPANPHKTGYIFKGWDQSFTNVTSNLMIKPLFEINKYTVKFYDANNNVINTQTVNFASSAVEPTAPVKDGYTFKGWDKEFDYVTSNLNIYPIFSLNTDVENNTTYTVTFLDNKGNLLSTQTVKKGEAATAPSAPNINFYKFVKWDTDFSNVTSNLTIKPIYEKTHTTYAINNVNYWLQILTDKYDLQEELLSRSEINAYNQKVLSDYSKTKVLDVTKIASTTTGTAVKELINKYTNISKYTVYNASTKTAITSTEKNTILNNRALTSITSSVTVKYGLIVDFAWVRSYPTNHYSNDYYMDRFQETSLNVGEAVAIYHTSSDGNWYFVQAQNYNGWVEKKFIAECSYSEMTSFLNPTNRLVVISNYETIEGSHVRMGQSFPLLSQGSSYQISFPTRNSSGKLVLKTVTLNNKDSYSVGYLPYTYENVFKQAFKLLGINYSWGDKELNGRDCSSTMNAIYACFGFMMPRNTSNQVSIPTYGTKISGITSSIMKTYKPGTLIFTSSHVMMYIGENESGVSYLLHNTNSGNGECILQSLDSYGGSKIIGTLKLQ